MPVWAWLLIFFVLLGGLGFLTERRSRRVRDGLEKPAGAGDPSWTEPKSRADRMLPGSTPLNQAHGGGINGG